VGLGQHDRNGTVCVFDASTWGLAEMSGSLEPISFYVLAAGCLYFAYRMLTSPNPIHSALFLVLTMIDLAAIYFTLNAQFIAGVQLIVYAGAVMVLFVMVVMLFDLQHEIRAFTKGVFSGLVKIVSAALLAGYFIGVADESIDRSRLTTLKGGDEITKELAVLIFDKYLLLFEVLGVLLLLIAVGVVSLSRVRGGTHARS
jgi:NADH-quinone oxidoreductase subunit J